MIGHPLVVPTMMQYPALTHTLLGAVSGVIIAAALNRTRGLALVVMLIAATLTVYTIVDAGVPEFEQRVAAAIAVVRKHGDFFRGLVIGKAIFALIAAGFYAGRRSRGALG
jgi:hypothetical protein